MPYSEISQAQHQKRHLERHWQLLHKKQDCIISLQHVMMENKKIPSNISQSKALDRKSVMSGNVLEKNLDFFRKELTADQFIAMQWTVLGHEPSEVQQLREIIIKQGTYAYYQYMESRRIIQLLQDKYSIQNFQLGHLQEAWQQFVDALKIQHEIVKLPIFSYNPEQWVDSLSVHFASEENALKILESMMSSELSYGTRIDDAYDELIIALSNLANLTKNDYPAKSAFFLNISMNFKKHRSAYLAAFQATPKSGYKAHIYIHEIFWGRANIQSLGLDLATTYIINNPLKSLVDNFLQGKLSMDSEGTLKEELDASPKKPTLSESKTVRTVLTNLNMLKSLAAMPLQLLQPLQLLLLSKMPSNVQARFFAKMINARSYQQSSGVPDMTKYLSKFMRSIIKMNAYGYIRFRYFFVMAQFQAYNVKKDAFEVRKGMLVKYDLDHEDSRQVRRELIQKLNCITFTIPIHANGIILLPMPRPVGTIDIPIPLMVGCPTNPKQSIDPLFVRDFDIYFDEYSRLYLDLGKYTHNEIEVTIAFVNPKREDIDHKYVHYAMKKNKAYFSPDAPPMEYSNDIRNLQLPSVIESKIKELQYARVQVIEKVSSVQKFIQDFLDYPILVSLFFTLVRKGSSDFEKSLNARSGNCFDGNKLGFIMLTKLGIPVQLMTGFAGTKYDNAETDASYNVHLGHVTKTIASSIELIDPKHQKAGQVPKGHAMCLYYDHDTPSFNIVDFTPMTRSSKKLEKLEKRSYEDVKIKSNYQLRLKEEKLRSLGLPTPAELKAESLKHPLRVSNLIWCRYSNNFTYKKYEKTNILTITWWHEGIGYSHPTISDDHKFSMEDFIVQAMHIQKLRDVWNSVLDMVELQARKIFATIRPLLEKAYYEASTEDRATFLTGIGQTVRSFEEIKKMVGRNESKLIDYSACWIAANFIGRAPSISIVNMGQKKVEFRMNSDSKKLYTPSKMAEHLQKLVGKWIEESDADLKKVKELLERYHYSLTNMANKDLLLRIYDKLAEIHKFNYDDYMLGYPSSVLNWQEPFDDVKFERWTNVVRLLPKDAYILGHHIRQSLQGRTMPLFNALMVMKFGRNWDEDFENEKMWHRMRRNKIMITGWRDPNEKKGTQKPSGIRVRFKMPK